MTNIIINNANVYSKHIMGLDKPFNIRKGWNIFKFNTNTCELIKYNNYDYYLVQTIFHFCGEFRGLHQPNKNNLHIPIKLFERISYHIIKKYGSQSIPQWIGIGINRFSKENGTHKGKIRYEFAILTDYEFEICYNEFSKFNKTIKLQEYINHLD